MSRNNSIDTVRILAKFSTKCVCGSLTPIGEPISFHRPTRKVIECPRCEGKRRAKSLPPEVKLPLEIVVQPYDYIIPELGDVD